MKEIKIINIIVSFLILLGIVVFVNLKTDNSLASIYKAFNPCDVKNVNNCDSEELRKLIKDILD